MLRAFTFAAILGLSLVSPLVTTAPADEPAAAAKSDAKKPTREELYKKFEESMTGVKLVGQFTVVGKNTPPAKEEYAILSCKKMPDGDFWLLQARIKYGTNDVTVPLPIEIKWAESTPVITLDNFTIPGLGTFNSRVLFDGNTYAGTWSHGKVGGHLFGTIEKITDKSPAEKPATEKPSSEK